MKNLKMLFTLAVIAGIIFLAIKVGPPFISNYELQQDLDTIARMATYAQAKSAKDITDDVIAKAKDDDVVLTPDNVNVDKTAVGVNIDVKYEVPISLPGKVVVLKFNPTAGNKLLTAK